ncbi:MAG: hypothetical protein WCD76_14035 [Pyrinomonadaceae bacterium]
MSAEHLSASHRQFPPTPARHMDAGNSARPDATPTNAPAGPTHFTNEFSQRKG